MKIELEPIVYEQKSVLRNLLELYEYDSSEFNGKDLDAHGLFGYRYLDHYWTEDGRYAYFIRCGGKLAGFALVRTLDSSGDVALYSMSEFFVVRKYRGKGLGKQAAILLFDKFPGQWEVSQEVENINAQRFWNHVIDEYTNGSYTEQIFEDRPLLNFRSKAIISNDNAGQRKTRRTGPF